MASGTDPHRYPGEQFRDYIERTKLKKLFKGLLQQVLAEQPADPLGYFSEKIEEVRKEMKESNVEIASTAFITSVEDGENENNPISTTNNFN
jgi:hypothetical protein